MNASRLGCCVAIPEMPVVVLRAPHILDPQNVISQMGHFMQQNVTQFQNRRSRVNGNSEVGQGCFFSLALEGMSKPAGETLLRLANGNDHFGWKCITHEAPVEKRVGAL